MNKIIFLFLFLITPQVKPMFQGQQLQQPSPEQVLTLGSQYLKSGQHQLARPLLEDAYQRLTDRSVQVIAAFNLARLYDQDKNHTKAEQLYLRAYDQQVNLEIKYAAANNLATLYINGAEGVDKDPAKAERLYLEAKNQTDYPKISSVAENNLKILQQQQSAENSDQDQLLESDKESEIPVSTAVIPRD